MAVGAVQERRVAVAYGVDVLPRWQLVRSPLGVVPAAAQKPLAGWKLRRIGADAGLHVGQGCRPVEVDGKPLPACHPHVGMSIVEPGHDEVAAQVDYLRVLALERQHFLVAAHCEYAAVRNGDGGYAARNRVGVVRLEPCAGKNVAMEEDRFG